MDDFPQFPTPDSWTIYYDSVAEVWNQALDIDNNVLDQFRSNGKNWLTLNCTMYKPTTSNR